MRKILKTLYGFLLYSKPLFALMVLLIIVSAILQSSIPYFYKLFVNNLTGQKTYPILTILYVYIGARFLAVLIEGASHLVGDFILKEAAATARTTIFKYVQDLDFFFHSNKSTGALISAFKRGDGAFFNLYHNLHFQILNVFVGFLVLVYFFAKIDPIFALCAMASFIAMLTTALLVIQLNIRARNIFNDQEDKISGVLTDNLIGYETVKLFAKERWEQNRLANLFTYWKHYLWKYGLTFRFWEISIGTIVNISILIILAVAVSQFSQTRLQLGDVVLILAFIDSFYPKVYELVWGFREIAKNYTDIQKYFGLLDYQIEIKDPLHPTILPHIRGNIVYDHVSFSYKEGKRGAVTNFSLNIREGQSIALVGRSGSGKTTLTKLLLRFFDVDQGHITIDGVNVKEMDKSYLRSFIGVVPQEPILFNNTIRYNIGYGKDNATLKEIKAASKMANIDQFIESLPQRYETNVGERGIKLSSGQKQRLAIARMILSDPDIIIFDEATSHLDSESEKLIQDAFWKAARNKTTIIIAHRLSTITRVDKIIVLDNGRIVEEGTHTNLFNNPKSLYSHFWKLQIRNK